MNKFLYLFKDADQETRIKSYITYGCLLAAILILIISAISVVNGPITNFPMLQLVATEDELDEFDDRFTDLADEIEDAIDEKDDDYLDDLEDELGMKPEKLIKLFEKPLSISTLRTFSKIYDDSREAVIALDLIINIITASTIIFIVLLLLGGFFMSKALVIVTIVLSIGYFLALVGFVWFILFLALCIAFAVMVSPLKKMHKNRNSVTEAIEE